MGNFFSELCEIETNINVGAQYLKTLLALDAKANPQVSAETKRFEQFLTSYDYSAESVDVTRIKLSLLRWNGGGNLNYPHEVWARVRNKTAADFLKQ